MDSSRSREIQYEEYLDRLIQRLGPERAPSVIELLLGGEPLTSVLESLPREDPGAAEDLMGLLELEMQLGGPAAWREYRRRLLESRLEQLRERSGDRDWAQTPSAVPPVPPEHGVAMPLKPTGNQILLRLHLGGERPADARSTFWAPFVREAELPGTMAPTPEMLEARVRSQFPIRLKEQLLTLEGGTPGRTYQAERMRKEAGVPPATHTEHLRRLVVVVHEVGYSSFDMLASFEPLRSLVIGFDANFDYFHAFLRSYVPEALFMSLLPPGSPAAPGWRDLVDRMTVDVQPSYGLLQAFAEASRGSGGVVAIPANDDSETARRARWLWLAANTSLVVPVLLAAWFLYSRSASLDRRAAEIDRAHIDLIEKQQALIQVLAPRDTAARILQASPAQATDTAR